MNMDGNSDKFKSNNSTGPDSVNSSKGHTTNKGNQHGIESDITTDVGEKDSVPKNTTDSIKPEKNELEMLKETLLRTLAENDNLRKRFEKEKEDLLKYSMNKFAADMITVSDNIGRALGNIDSSTAVEKIKDGLLIVEKEILTIFKKNHIEKIEVKLGDKFTPTIHQAVLEEENTKLGKGTISKIMQDGYTINERLLRPVMVAVAK